jgi:hypothetical protein
MHDWQYPEPGPVHATGMAATGAGFSQFQEQGANCNELLERRATTKWGKPAPSLRVAEKIRPYFILALDGGPATAFGFGFVWPDFRSQRHPPQ